MSREKLRRWTAASAAAIALLAGGCSDSGSEPIEVTLGVFADPPSISLTGSSTVTAQVMLSQGNPGGGWVIEWGNTLGTLQVTNSVADANGRARATLRGAGVSGIATVTARIQNRSAQAQTQVRIGLD